MISDAKKSLRMGAFEAGSKVREWSIRSPGVGMGSMEVALYRVHPRTLAKRAI